MRALVAGHLCIDFFPQMDRAPGLVEGALYDLGPMRARPGGCVYTTGKTMEALGVDVSVAAAVGDDSLAELLLDLCRAEGLDTAGLIRTEASTSYTIVSQPPGRDRTFWHHLGANQLFDGRNLDLDGIDLLHVGYPNLMALLYLDDGARTVRAVPAGPGQRLRHLDRPGRHRRRRAGPGGTVDPVPRPGAALDRHHLPEPGRPRLGRRLAGRGDAGDDG